MVLDVLLPISDMCGDKYLVIVWYLGCHYRYAMSMMIPLLLNLIFTCFKWWSFEKKKNKWWSSILVILEFWQPWRAMKIVYLLYKNDNQAQAKKKEFMREVLSIEPFLEAVPTCIIMTFLWIHGFGESIHLLDDGAWGWYRGVLIEDYRNGLCNNVSLYEFCSQGGVNTSSISRQEYNYCAIFAGGFGWFFIKYSISVMTASLGITKLLLHGPCAIISSNGTLGGLLTCEFLTATTVSALAIVSKGAFGGQLFIVLTRETNRYDAWIPICLFVSFCIIPNLLFGLACIAMETGWNINLATTIFEYPAMLLLPVFSTFAVAPKQMANWPDPQKTAKRSLLVISMRMTAMNSILTFTCYIIGFIIECTMANVWNVFIAFGIVLPVFLECLIFTMIFIFCGPHSRTMMRIHQGGITE